MKLSLAIAIFLTSWLHAQTTLLKVVPVTIGRLPAAIPPSIKFACTADYDEKQCAVDSDTLVSVLKNYPASRLGGWTFVLASSGHRRSLVLALGGNPGSPAFTHLGSRVTVLKDAFFAGHAQGLSELMSRSGMPPTSCWNSPSLTSWALPSARNGTRFGRTSSPYCYAARAWPFAQATAD
jgi:hypothetical protein